MNAQHTPGPWIVTEHTRRPLGLSYHWRIQRTEDRDDDVLAVVPSEYPGEDAGEEADARLIAAAPELLEACKRVLALANDVTDSPMWPVSGPVFDAIRNAIAKASGNGGGK